MEEILKSAENSLEKNKLEEEIEKAIKEMAVAAGNALSFEHFEFRQKKEDRLARRIASGGKLTAEETEFMADENKPNEVRFSNIEVMKEIFVKIGLDKELIDKTIEHEAAHFKTAQEEGLNACFILRFYKTKKGIITFLPAVKVSFEKGGQGFGEVSEKIAKAPSVPSKSDEAKLK